jgi:uncharacterized protein YdhG (YjbR/CyaY superfamily)
MMSATVDAYIAGFPADTQAALVQVRQAIAAAIPAAEEIISYKMPAFRLNGRIVIYFAGYKSHIGLYPVHLAMPDLADELAPFLSGKSTAKFPLDTPMPLKLVGKLATVMAAAVTNKTPPKAERLRQ